MVSGGLDSCVMLAALARRFTVVHPVFIRHGLVWEEAELRHLRRFLRALSDHASRITGHESPITSYRSSLSAVRFPLGRLRPLTVLSLPVRDLYGRHWSTTGRGVPSATSPDQAVYLPGRNLLLLSKAAVFCARHGIGVLAVGSLGHNPFPDARPEFFRRWAAAAGDALGCRLKVIAPFRALTKSQVVRRGVRFGLPLHLSFSCIAPRRGRHCGHCNKCAERQRAFREAGVPDRTRYRF